MGGSIHFMSEDGELIRLDEEAWAKEVDFQALLAAHPDLLGADQIDDADPPRWLHIKGETAVPDSDDLKSRWSVDHLFIDQFGIPTLVEVKRSSDTRLRREVIGQILDYAANAVAYWSAEHIRTILGNRCEAMGLDPDEETRAVIGVDTDIDEFWMTVKTNLRAGRVRLLIVADEIPSELHRIVEFLNKQMDPAQILAVEVKRFIHGDQTVLVPRVMGQTAESEARKSVGRPGGVWDEESVFDDLAQRVGSEEVAKARRMFDWIRGSGLAVAFGSGVSAGSFSARVESRFGTFSLFNVYSSGRVELPIASFKVPFDTDEKREPVIERLQDTGLDFSGRRANKYPTFALEEFDADRLDDWLDVWAWAISEIQAASDG